MARKQAPPREARDAVLRWSLDTFAQAKGYTRPWEVAKVSGLGFETIALAWERRGKAVFVETIRRLCIALDAAPPGVFAWADEPANEAQRVAQQGPPYLVWRVQELAAKRKMDRITVARTAEIFFAELPHSKPSMMETIWSGQHRSISLKALSGLVRALQVPPGDLFTWEI